MEKHPVDLENGYKIRAVYAPQTEEGGYGDIYSFPEEVMLEYPGQKILTGYCVIAEESGLVPDGCNDWNVSIEAAMQDYEEHVLPDLVQEKQEDVDKKIKVVLLEPGKLARSAEIDSSLRGMQQLVGGYIELFYPFEEAVCVVLNEEGKLTGLPLNRAFRDEGPDHQILDIIAGTCFICDCSGEDFASLTDEQLQHYENKFKYPETFFMLGNEICAVPYMPEIEEERTDFSSAVKNATDRAASGKNQERDTKADHER